jgi:hypothetical protein
MLLSEQRAVAKRSNDLNPNFTQIYDLRVKLWTPHLVVHMIRCRTFTCF